MAKPFAPAQPEATRSRFSGYGVIAIQVGMALLSAVHPSAACLIPDGADDDAYIAFGRQYQTNLLSLHIVGTDPNTGQATHAVNASAAYLNSRFALTAAHIFKLFPDNSELTIEVGTGSNFVTNRGTVFTVSKYLIHPGYDDGNSGATTDVAILCLPTVLPGPDVTITNASIGEIVTEAGFGYHGSPSTGTTFDKNSRAWNAPVGEGAINFSSEYYAQTHFHPYIPMNGKGAERDSGGPVTKNGNQNSLIGLGIAQAGDFSAVGATIFIKLSHPDIRSWIELNTSLTPSLAIDADKRISLTGNPNLLYGLQASTNLVDWQEIGVLTNSTGTVSFQDPDTTNFPMRAYRAVVK